MNQPEIVMIMTNCTRFIQGKLSHVQYLPAKPIKRGIKVWMHCDTDTAHLHQFEVYLVQQQNSAFGLGYDVGDGAM